MYEYILKNKRATYALDNINGLETFENTKNVNEIIITKNNLEQMKNIYDNIEANYNNEISDLKQKYKKIILWVIIYSILSLIFKIPYYALALTMTIPVSKTIINLIKENKIKKKYTNTLNNINNAIVEESNKLEFLKNTDKKIEIKENQEKIVLETSPEVELLISKIVVDAFVYENSKNLKILYKENLLEETLQETFTPEEIDYIKSLFAKEKNKVKQLKK